MGISLLDSSVVKREKKEKNGNEERQILFTPVIYEQS